MTIPTVTFHRPDVNSPSVLAGGGDAGVTVPPAISSRVCGTVGKAAPGPAVPRRKVTMVFWLNDIRFTQTQVGGLRLVFKGGGSV